MRFPTRLIIPPVAFVAGLAVLGVSAADSAVRAERAERGRVFAADLASAARSPRVTPGYEQSARVTGAAILGEDERVRIDDTTAFPWRTISWLELFDQSGQPEGHCTGTFIGPDALLTAAHCLWNAEQGSWTRQIAVVPAKNGADEPFGFEWASNWWVPDAYIDSGGDSSWDWGIVKLDSDVLGRTVGWLQVAQLTNATLSRPDVAPAIFGYPADKKDDEAGTMWGGIKDELLAVDSRELRHEIDTFPGESGAAIFSANAQDPSIFGLVVGVHTTGGTDFNRGIRIDSGLLDDILEGCRVMRCTIAYVVEPELGPGPRATPEPAPPSELPPRAFRVFVPDVGSDR